MRTTNEVDLIQQIIDKRGSGQIAEASLHTDDRVLARITDGIYRQPSSALRELISNAYDADATEVYIETNAPRFTRIRIRDNGRGMSEFALASLIHHIGGSSKRTLRGIELGTASESDPNRSPAGRRLIGKIGIGLFSVSQLTQHFQIITKTKGSSYRLFADVVLKTYSEDDAALTTGKKFETGTVKITSVPAEDIESHGTEIILLEVRPRARDILRSKQRWEQLNAPEDERNPDVVKPIYHIGYVAQEPKAEEDELAYMEEPVLPWNKDIPPQERIQTLFEAVAGQVGSTTANPDLENTLDSYLETIWTLSLAAPVSYLEKHPFDIDESDGIAAFKLSNGRGQAEPVQLDGQTIAGALELAAAEVDPCGGFRVFFDEVELKRPISYRYWPSSRQQITHPLIFVGANEPDLSRIPESFRGGELAFEAYFFWNSKIVPKENNGILIRINNSSGALFDDTFMKYQVSEQTRLRQITAEIFVHRGLDAALNIDRESFNYAHPHYQIIQQWVHKALRQLTNKHKGLSKEIRDVKVIEARDIRRSRLEDHTTRVWQRARHDESEVPPSVAIAATATEAARLRKEGVLAFEQAKIDQAVVPRPSKPDSERDDQFRALALVLDAFGLLESMSYERQHELLEAILKIFVPEEA